MIAAGLPAERNQYYEEAEPRQVSTVSVPNFGFNPLGSGGNAAER